MLYADVSRIYVTVKIRELYTRHQNLDGKEFPEIKLFKDRIHHICLQGKAFCQFSHEFSSHD